MSWFIWSRVKQKGSDCKGHLSVSSSYNDVFISSPWELSLCSSCKRLLRESVKSSSLNIRSAHHHVLPGRQQTVRLRDADLYAASMKGENNYSEEERQHSVVFLTLSFQILSDSCATETVCLSVCHWTMRGWWVLITNVRIACFCQVKWTAKRLEVFRPDTWGPTEQSVQSEAFIFFLLFHF